MFIPDAGLEGSSIGSRRGSAPHSDLISEIQNGIQLRRSGNGSQQMPVTQSQTGKHKSVSGLS